MVESLIRHKLCEKVDRYFTSMHKTCIDGYVSDVFNSSQYGFVALKCGCVGLIDQRFSSIVWQKWCTILSLKWTNIVLFGKFERKWLHHPFSRMAIIAKEICDTYDGAQYNECQGYKLTVCKPSPSSYIAYQCACKCVCWLTNISIYLIKYIKWYFEL